MLFPFVADLTDTVRVSWEHQPIMLGWCGCNHQHFGYEQTNNKDSDVCIVAFPGVSILLDRQSIPLWRQVRATLIRSPLYWGPAAPYVFFHPTHWSCLDHMRTEDAPWSAASKSNCKKPGPGASWELPFSLPPPIFLDFVGMESIIETDLTYF